MRAKGRIAFIVEGAKSERIIFNSMKRVFFRDTHIEMILLSAEENIHMLWKEIKADPDLDIIELLREKSEKLADTIGERVREDFSEVYLFFDFDPQHHAGFENGFTDSVRSEITEMANFFDNETEHGKLYISYPMVEAIRDSVPASCRAFNKCYLSASEIGRYKKNTGSGNPFAVYTQYMQEGWKHFIRVFLGRIACMSKDGFMRGSDDGCYTKYHSDNISPSQILAHELALFSNTHKLLVLSSLPEYLLDYFSAEYWEKLDFSADLDRGIKCDNPEMNLPPSSAGLA